MSAAPSPYGIAAEFGSPARLVEAAARLRREGYRDIEAYSAVPVDGLDEALGISVAALPLWALAGAAIGGGGTFLMQEYASVWSYPWNIGGRPLNSWPAFVLPSIEIAVLGAVVAVVAGMLWLSRLPRLNHPIFNIDRFSFAAPDRYFLCIRATDRRYDPEATRHLLTDLSPGLVTEVPR